MIITEEKNTHKLAEVWLECSLASHDFIDLEYWKTNFADMRDKYLPSAVNYALRDSSEGEVKGFISLSGNHIEALFVDIQYQGQGIGKNLIGFAKTLHDILTVTVYTKNRKAVSFYERNGFIPGVPTTDPATGETECIMEYRADG